MEVIQVEVVEVSCAGRALGRFEVLRGWWERARGLLGRDEGRQVALVPCRSIHTFGMRFPIDVALVDGAGKVLLSRRAVGPGHVVSAEGTRLVLERRARVGWWPAGGERLQMVGAVGTGPVREVRP